MAKRYVEICAHPLRGPVYEVMECEGGKAGFKRNVALSVNFWKGEGYPVYTRFGRKVKAMVNSQEVR